MREGTPSGQPLPEASAQDQAVAKALSVLGAQLRQGREAKGIPQPELAKRLFFRQEQLEALEAGDRSALPELVYVIAQAQRVANVLGLDVAPLLLPLRHLQKSGPPHRCLDPSASTPRQAEPRTSPNKAGGMGKGIAVVALILGTGSALVWGWQRFDGAGLQTWRPAQPAVPSAPQPKPAAAESGTEATPPQPASGASDPTGMPQPAPAPGDLLLSSSSPSWLEVRQVGCAAGEEVVFRGTFKGERRFLLGDGLKVLAGRPDLVTAQLEGQPAQRLGSIEQVQWRTFKPTDPASASDPASAAETP